MPCSGCMRPSALLVGGWFGQLTTPKPSSAVIPPEESPDWDALEKEAAEQTLRMGRSAALVIVAIVVGVWPLDLMFMHRDAAEQALFTAWRLSLIATFGTMYLTLTFLPAARRHPVLACAPFSVAACFGLAYCLARLGGLDRPYFYILCTAQIVPIVAPAHLLSRVAFLVSLSCGMLAGFFGYDRSYAGSPLLAQAILHLLTVMAGSALIGHGVYVSFCTRFFQGLQLERAVNALGTLNETLGERVQEKTADLRRLAEHLQTVQEEERGHIARELHDELGQRLSAMRYALASTRQRFARAPTAIAPNLNELDTMLDGTLDCVRHVVSGLRPPLLDQLGLAATIEWLSRRVGEQAGIDCTLDLVEDCPCSLAVSVAAYRILQESLTNVVRHADARRVDVRLRVSPERLLLEVTDDGRGFPEQGPPSNHNGLLGMHERARALGGELVTSNLPTGGARVRVDLPLAPANEGGRA